MLRHMEHVKATHKHVIPLGATLVNVRMYEEGEHGQHQLLKLDESSLLRIGMEWENGIWVPKKV